MRLTFDILPSVNILSIRHLRKKRKQKKNMKFGSSSRTMNELFGAVKEFWAGNKITKKNWTWLLCCLPGFIHNFVEFISKFTLFCGEEKRKKKFSEFKLALWECLLQQKDYTVWIYRATSTKVINAIGFYAWFSLLHFLWEFFWIFMTKDDYFRFLRSPIQ